MITQFGSGAPGIYAVVSDSYDIYNAASKIWGEELKAEVLAADNVLVIRPDSGQPVEVVEKLLKILGEKFGFTINAKGYKVLHPKVRLIWGDGIDLEGIDQILSSMKSHGWSVDNIAFGMGGGLHQKVNRDTQRFAIKCSHAIVDGKGRDVFKKPVTDFTKSSLKGRLKLVQENSEIKTVATSEAGEDLLRPVFYNGHILEYPTLSDMRVRAALR